MCYRRSLRQHFPNQNLSEYIHKLLHQTKLMNNKRLEELKEQVKYRIELYVDPIGQYLRTRPRQKPKEESNTTS